MQRHITEAPCLRNVNSHKTSMNSKPELTDPIFNSNFLGNVKTTDSWKIQFICQVIKVTDRAEPTLFLNKMQYEVFLTIYV